MGRMLNLPVFLTWNSSQKLSHLGRPPRVTFTSHLICVPNLPPQAWWGCVRSAAPVQSSLTDRKQNNTFKELKKVSTGKQDDKDSEKFAIWEIQGNWLVNMLISVLIRHVSENKVQGSRTRGRFWGINKLSWRFKSRISEEEKKSLDNQIYVRIYDDHPCMLAPQRSEHSEKNLQKRPRNVSSSSSSYTHRSIYSASKGAYLWYKEGLLHSSRPSGV